MNNPYDKLENNDEQREAKSADLLDQPRQRQLDEIGRRSSRSRIADTILRGSEGEVYRGLLSVGKLGLLYEEGEENENRYYFPYLNSY